MGYSFIIIAISSKIPLLEKKNFYDVKIVVKHNITRAARQSDCNENEMNNTQACA